MRQILLMLHGFSRVFRQRGPNWPNALSGPLRCIAPDQRGYGQSWAPVDVARFMQRANWWGDMVALIDHLAPRPVTVSGSDDWGAICRLLLAARQPETGRLA